MKYVASVDAGNLEAIARLSGPTGATVGIVLVGLGTVLRGVGRVLESRDLQREQGERRVERRGRRLRLLPRLSGALWSADPVRCEGQSRSSVSRSAGAATRP